MIDLSELVREYGELLDQEQRLGRKKQEVRAQILNLLMSQGLRTSATPFGTAKRCARFKLTPRREPVLALLNGNDLFPFTSFTPNRVKEALVPKYGRERLLPLFDIEKTEYLMISRDKSRKPYG
jgi:hypothetical protein